MHERRQFSRVSFVTHVDIDFEDHKCTGKLLDISLKGALIEQAAPAFLELGNRGVITIYLSDTDIALTFSGEVAHVSGNRAGMKFLHEDIDSMTHLRRLLELNLGSDETITRELSHVIEAS